MSGNILLVIYLLATILSCNAIEMAHDHNDKSVKTYVDSVEIVVPKINIVSLSLLAMIDTLVGEGSRINLGDDFGTIPGFVFVTLDTIPERALYISLRKNYLSVLDIPGNKEINPMRRNKNSEENFILGAAIYNEIPILFHVLISKFKKLNENQQIELIELREDSISFPIYALKNLDSKEWVYSVMPSLVVHCKIRNDSLIFSNFSHEKSGLIKLKNK